MPLTNAQASALLLMRRINGGMDIYHPLTSALSVLPTGQTVNIVGENYASETYKGIPCMRFSATGTAQDSTYFRIPYPARPYYTARWHGTISVWLSWQGFTTNWRSLKAMRVGPGTFSASSGSVEIMKRNLGSSHLYGGIQYSSSYGGMKQLFSASDNSWHHVAIIADTHTATSGGSSPWDCDVFLDGEYVGHSTENMSNVAFSAAYIGLYMGNSTETGSLRMASFRVWRRPLSASEIAVLAKEFTPEP